MDRLEFEWDEEKARTNERKHGVTFREAATIFGDRLGRLQRSRFVEGEDRRAMVGLSGMGRLLVVVFVERRRIRIISARRATPFERHDYQEAGG